MFAGLMGVQWLAAIAIAVWVSPLTWKAGSSEVHPHILGTIYPAILDLTKSGATSTRYIIAVAHK